VSIVVPCKNEELHIARCVESLFALNFEESHEVIVVDGNSTDTTPALLAELQGRFPKLKIVVNPNGLTPVSMNMGINNQDIELSKRILKKGKDIYLVPSVSCNYYARESYGGIAKNNFRNGYWNLLTGYITRNPESLSIRHFVPLGFILSLFVSLLIGLSWLPGIFTFIGILTLYLLDIIR